MDINPKLNFCRMCLGVTDLSSSIDDRVLATFQSVTGVDISSDGNFFTCKNCLEKLDYIENFRLKTRLIDKMYVQPFRDGLESPKHVKKDTPMEFEARSGYAQQNNSPMDVDQSVKLTTDDPQAGSEDLLVSMDSSNNQLAIKNSSFESQADVHQQQPEAESSLPQFSKYEVDYVTSSDQIVASSSRKDFEVERSVENNLRLEQSGKLKPKVANANYTCKFCGKEFTKRRLAEHMRSVHQNLLLKCTKCDKSFVLKHNLSRHEKSEHSPDKTTCMQCNKTFETEEGLKLHVGATNAGKGLSCSSFNENCSGKRYECRMCQESFNSLYDLREHMKFKHLNATLC